MHSLGQAPIGGNAAGDANDALPAGSPGTTRSCPSSSTGPTSAGGSARLDSVLETILGQHDYPAPVAALVAEATLITALIGQTIKLRWRLSLQIRGGGPVRLIATDYFGPSEEGRRRGCAPTPASTPTGSPRGDGRPFDLLGKGVFAILIDQGPGSAPYQGMTPIAGQLARRLRRDLLRPVRAAADALRARDGRGGGAGRRGALARRRRAPAAHAEGLADADQEATGFDGLLARRGHAGGSDAENWRRAVMLLETVEATELIGPHVGAEELLLRLFNDEGPRVYARAAGALRLHLRPREGGAVAVRLLGRGDRRHDHGRGQGHRRLPVLRRPLRVRPGRARRRGRPAARSPRNVALHDTDRPIAPVEPFRPGVSSGSGRPPPRAAASRPPRVRPLPFARAAAARQASVIAGKGEAPPQCRAMCAQRAQVNQAIEKYDKQVRC